jgi:PAS domain S-box-containing protein
MVASERSESQNRVRAGYRYVSQLAIVFALYFGVGKLGLAVPFTSSNISPVWPAAGIAVAAVLVWGIQIAPAIALAAFLVNFLTPIPTSASIAIGLGNASSAVVAGYLLVRFSDFQISLPRLRDVLRLVTVAAVVATTIAATVGVTALTITHAKAWSGYGSAWRIWWLGDAMGVLVVTPLVLAGEELLRVCRGWRALELSVVFAAVLATSFLVFGRWTAVRDDVLAFVVFPFVVWAALRFRVAGAALISLMTASVAVWGTARGLGPFVNHAPLHNTVLLQVFIAVTSLTGLMLAAVINEKEHLGAAFETNQKLLGETEAANVRLEERGRERTRELERKTTQLGDQAKLLDLANDAILVRTTDGRITYWNEGAERLYGWTRVEALGKTTQELIRGEFPEDVSDILALDRWEGELRQQRRDGSELTVASRWRTLHDSDGKPVGWLEINTDITARKRAEDAARSLSAKILSMQDEERRRIARGLHDSIGQYLIALKMNLDLLLNTNGKQIVADCGEIVDKCIAETRTISYLLHPPLLDEAGLGSAARWYVDGFAQRSGIKVNLEFPAELGRLRSDVETALFRALQEGLTNVHRHSESSAVDICFTAAVNEVRLEIRDNGRGVPPNILKHLAQGIADSGVGIAGMRERMRELGGSLQIKSDKKGTLLRVTIPISQAAEKSVEADRNPSKRVSPA